MALDTMTLGQLESQDLDPNLALLAARLLATTYPRFIEVLYKDLDQSVTYLEETRNLRQEDGEDHLTADLIGQLQARGYDASHDQMIGGHVDIAVRHKRGFLWLGEAKIHSDYEYLWKGFNQLCGRYAPGTPGTLEGGLIIYVRNKDCAAVVAQWRKRIAEKALPDYAESECDARPGLAFFTTHKHTDSGLTMRVRHVAVVQHWDPPDRAL